MKKKVLVIGTVAATVLVGGWALAQTTGHGPGGFGPPFMRGEGHGGMGPGIMQHMGQAMGKDMMQHKAARMGWHDARHSMGPGMMHGGAGPKQFDPARIETLKTELAHHCRPGAGLDQIRQGSR